MGEEYTFTCDHCCEDRTDEPEVSDGRVELCEDCAEDFFTCERCHYVDYADEIRAVADEYWCEHCADEYAGTCEHCDREYPEREILSFGNITLCEDCCQDHYFTCHACEYAYPLDYDEHYDESSGYSYCRDCAPEHRELDRAAYHNVESGSVRRSGRTFGVEVEVMFPDGSPWYLGGYHSYRQAPEGTFYSGWRGEDDATVDGEFISPPMGGAAGLAELIATFGRLEDNGASVGPKTGQHITVDVTPDTWRTEDQQIKVQRLMLALEDAMLALTGSYQRLQGVTYHHRIKGSTYNTRAVKDKQGAYTRELSAGIKENGLVEFRYPPGTLNPAQAAINVGLVQLLCDLAEEMSDEDVDKLVEESLAIEANPNLSTLERIHMQVRLGLGVFTVNGWHEGGSFEGLPYDPDDAPIVQIGDRYYGHVDTVALPSSETLRERMYRQLDRFYKRMFPEDVRAAEDCLHQAYSLVAIAENAQQLALAI